MEWLIYLLKVSACTTLFFGFYLLVLRRLTFFKINRFYLIISLVISFIIPAIQINVEQPAQPLPVSAQQELIVQSPEIIPSSPPQIILNEPAAINWFAWAETAYIVVAVSLFLICIWQLFQLFTQAKKYTKQINGLKLIPKESGFTNCSFFNYVFINCDSLTDNELEVLLKHEQVHANQYHSADKILMMICKSILWFNPIVYLYSKALEQTHEYEADQLTSLSFGNKDYAGLLLKLAVTKSSMPLVHNFVKSPIKERIKMLFQSKSKNMKKLMYLLVLPFGLGLMWLFSVQIVYAQTQTPTKAKVTSDDDLIGKSISGEVAGLEKQGIGYTYNLLSGSTVYSIDAAGFKDKIKQGDKVVAYVDGAIKNFRKFDKNKKLIASTDKIIYILSKLTTENGKLIYERKVIKSAFLYEVNKARFASSKIKAIEKSTNGFVNKIVLNDGTFTINLNLNNQNLKDNNFKVGDDVLVKFIGEKLISQNTYTTDKMIVMYSDPKKYILKNELLYNRFYDDNGKQKLVSVSIDTAKIGTMVMPKIITFTKVIGDIKNKLSKLEGVEMEIYGGKLKAAYAEMDMKNGIINAKDVAFVNKYGNEVSSKTMVFELKKGTYYAHAELKQLNNTPLELKHESNVDDKFEYSAKDSVKMSKDKRTIYLYGEAKMRYKDFDITADEIIYNNKTLTGSAKNPVMVNRKTLTTIFGSLLKFDLKGKTEIWQD